MDNSNKIALIYSKLAELELSQKKQADIWKHIKQSFTAKQLDQDVVRNIEDVFREACIPPNKDDAIELSPESLKTGDVSESEQGTKASAAFDTTKLTSDTVKNIRVLFLAEQQFSDTLQQSISEKLKKLRTTQSTQDKLIPEIFRFREDLMKQEKKLNDYEELCRNLQKLSKEKDDHRRMLIEHEKNKSKQLEQECLQSIETVTKKIEEEENDLLITSNENQDLQMKLDQFMIHLKIRKEKLKNEEKTKELYFRLKEAKKSQFFYFIEQEKLKLSSYQSNINHAKETIHHLQSQVVNFSNKFYEFEQTLLKSSQVIEKVNERELMLLDMLDKLKSENDELKAKVTETDILMIQTIEKKRFTEEDLLKLKGNLSKLEKKCRKLLSKRQQLIKDYDIDESLINPTAAITSSSSSSSSSATTVVNAVNPVVTSVPSSDGVSEIAPQKTRTESPTSETSSKVSAVTTPSRKIHNFVLSSSSASSPSRNGTQAVGEGSPIGSPRGGDHRKN